MANANGLLQDFEDWQDTTERMFRQDESSEREGTSISGMHVDASDHFTQPRSRSLSGAEV